VAKANPPEGRVRDSARRVLGLGDSAATSICAPHGEQAMVQLPLSEAITISRHLRVRSLRAVAAAADHQAAGTGCLTLEASSTITQMTACQSASRTSTLVVLHV
jgi:hypothetical protein